MAYEEKNWESRAQRLTEDSEQRAIEGFLDLAGDFFDERAFAKGEPYPSRAKILLERIQNETKLVEAKRISRDPFWWSESSEALALVISLPGELWYCDYTRLIEFNPDLVGADFDKQLRDSTFSTSETDMRNDIVEALRVFCLKAATLARMTQSATLAGWRRLLLEIAERIEKSDDKDNEISEDFAKKFVADLRALARELWCDALIANEEAHWDDKAKNLGLIEPGEYAAAFVAVCSPKLGILKFTNNLEFRIAEKARAAWAVIRKLVQSKEPEGYEKLKTGWRSVFSRKDGAGEIDRNAATVKLLDFIVAETENPGQKGTRFHICPNPSAAKKSKQPARG